MDYFDDLISIFKQNENPVEARKMKKYMKDKFDYLGIKSPLRRELSASFLQKSNLPDLETANNLARKLWDQPYRELHYFALELLEKYKKKCPATQIGFYEWLILNKPWWDTVDGIAASLVGAYFQKYPEQKTDFIHKWLMSENMWLQRTTIIFQLKYKDKIDLEILERCIDHCRSSKEFFLRKAIGWALRQHAKTDPDYVIKFVNENPDLSNLSKREALKHLG